MKVLNRKQIFEQYKEVELDDGLTFGQVLDELGYPKEIHKYIQVRVNGQLVNKEYWYHAKPIKNTVTTVSLMPAGGGSNDLLRTLVIIGFTAAGTAIGGPGVGGAVGGAVGSMIGSQVANGMFPPSAPKVGKYPGDNKKLNSVSGQSNQYDPYGVVIRNYGTNKVFPRIIAQPNISNVGNDQYITSIYDFGAGKQEINVDTISIGENNLKFYKGVSYNIAYSPDDFVLYTNRVSSQFPNAEFENVNDTQIRTTDLNAESITLTLLWQGGLVAFYGKKFKARPLLQNLIVQLRETGSTVWRNITDFDFDLDPGLVADNFDYLGFIVAPTSGISPNVSFVKPTRIRSWSKSIGFFITQQVTYTEYRYSINSNEIWHKEITASDRDPNNQGIGLRDDYISRRLINGDKVYLGGSYYTVIDDNLGSVSVGGVTYYKVKLDRIARYETRVTIRDSYNTTSVASIGTANVVNNGNAITMGGRTSFATLEVRGRTTSQFRKEIRIYPNEGPKQWDIRVKYAALDPVDTGRTLVNAKQIRDNFILEQIKSHVKDNPVLETKEHTYLELKIKATDEINGQVNIISAIVDSYLPVYDEENGVWKEETSNNPAWVFAGILTNNSNQRAVGLDRLDVDSLVRWAKYCDEQKITFQGNEIGFECNFVLDYSITVKQLLEQVCSAGRATLNLNNGKYGVLIDELKETPTQMFNQRNVTSMGVSREYVKTPDGIRVEFIDPLAGWQKNTVVAYDDGKDETSSVLIEDYEAFAVTNITQAWRQGRYFLAQQKLRRDNITIGVDFEHIACSRGDMVYFSHDVVKNGGTPARIKAINGNVVTLDELAVDQGGSQKLISRNRLTNEIVTYDIVSFPSLNQIELNAVDNIQVNDLIVYGISEQVVKKYIVKEIRNSDDLKAEIDLIDYNPAIFDADTGTIPEYDGSTVSDPLTGGAVPSPVENLEYEYTISAVQSEKRYKYNVLLSWESPEIGQIKNYEIYHTVNGETTLIGYSESNIFNYELNNNQIETQNTFKVLAVNIVGDKMPLGQAPNVTFTPFDDEVDPENVQEFNANVLTDTIELDWRLVGDNDIDYYLIRFSTNTETATWEQSTSIASAGPTQSNITVPLRTGTYLIRAVDYAGNFSPQASRIVTSVPELSKVQFITNISAPVWDGTFEDTQLLGDALIIKSIDNFNNFVEDEGQFFFKEIFDLGDIFTARFVADVVASGFTKSGLMANWTTLASVDPIAGNFNQDDFDAAAYIRTRNQPDVMANWTPLNTVDYLSFGTELTATPWVRFKSGDFTGRIFQLKVKLDSEDTQITPIVYSVNIDANWNERIIDGRDEQSGVRVVYDGAFTEPPFVTVVSRENVVLGDTYLFTEQDETGFTVQFYDTNGTPVNDRQFDWIAKGIGKKYTLEDINF
jgi:sulfur carrier protein ThiS